jgi:DNA modification methylase
MYKRTIQKELSFEGEKLTRGRHKVHPYPAMLHPLLVDYLLDKYAKKDATVFDPFCGSGVTLLQSAVKGYSSVGFDINPVALLIAKVKTSKYDVKKLKEEYEDFKKSVLETKKSDIPDIKNIGYWYAKDVIGDLGKIRAVLKNKKYKYQDFFVINFAYICRKQSLTRNGEFKRYRVKEEKVKTFQNKVLEKMFEHIETMIDIYSKSNIPKKESRPILANSEKTISPKITYDLVITSPPYGDSRTTVAYGQYSSFASEWTYDLNSYGGNDYKVDNESVGKVGTLNPELTKYKELTEILKKIEEIDKKRAQEVLYFYNGYYNVIRNVIKNLNKKGTVCFVVGNRTVKGYQIPMDQITAAFLESMGLKFEGIFVRDISSKVMPSQNSPSNKTGVKLQTMTNEYIVVFQKK